MHDDKLLTQYARDGSEAAFGQLVARHLNLVYSTCLRETGSPSQAEDAAQVVFLLLARKAKSLRAGPSLAGWLYKAARFVAKDVRKQEARRRLREERLMQEEMHRREPLAPEWEGVEPLLNDALSALKPAEREAVLLRFIEDHSLAETGAALGLSEDAARMRVARAVEKMRRHLTAHGAAITGVVLTGFLASEAARPAPADAAAITQATLRAIATGPTADVLLLSKGVYQTMKIIQVKLATLAAATLLVGAALPPLARALSPHRPDVLVKAHVSIPPVPLMGGITTNFTLDKGQHAYYRIALPKGVPTIILDIRRANGRWVTGNVNDTTTSLSYIDKEGQFIPKDIINHDLITMSFLEVENRLVDRPVFKRPVDLILDIHNAGEQYNYWLTVLPPKPTNATSASFGSQALSVPLFGGTVPRPMRLSKVETGHLAKSGYAYFAVPLKAGHYQASLDFSNASSKATNLNGTMALNDENGVMTGGAVMDIAQVHVDLGTVPPYRDVRAFTIKKGGVFLISVSNQGSDPSDADDDAVNFTARILPDVMGTRGKQN